MTSAFRAPPSGEFAWWKLTPKQKRVLQQRRLAGEYGGETAAGVGRAPYFWAQEYGNVAASIVGQGFATVAWNRFKSRGREVLRNLEQ